MATEITCQVAANRQIARDTYLLELDGDETTLNGPGQFVNLKVPGFFLRRPLSVCSVKPGRIYLLYKKVGAGTRTLAALPKGEQLRVLTGLGRGFWIPENANTDNNFRPALVGGGIGVAPLYWLAQTLLEREIFPQVIFGFRTATEVTLADTLERLGLSVHVATEDGTAGTRGFVTHVLEELLQRSATDTPNYVYSCGPTAMMKAVYQFGLPGQFSLEERMGCGIGACMGCVHPTHEGLLRVCKEGPVFSQEELAW